MKRQVRSLYRASMKPKSSSNIIKADQPIAAGDSLANTLTAPVFSVKTPNFRIAHSNQWTKHNSLQFLAQARKEANEILMAAKNEAEKTRKAAYEKGYQDGLEAGRQQGQQEGTAEGMALGWCNGMERAQHTINTAEEVLRVAEQVRKEALQSLEGDIIELALAIGEKIARHEISSNMAYITDFVEAVMQQNSSTSYITVRIPPGEGDNTAEQVGSVLQDLTENLRVVVDEDLEPGDCIVENEAGIYDGRVQSRLASMRSAFRAVQCVDIPN